MILDKKQIWELIKKREFDLPFENVLFELIEKNIERVEFIKDHIGLRDALFIAEKSTEGFFVSRMFSAIDTDADSDNSYEENEQSLLEKIENNPMKVLDDINDFFSKTDRTLYIGIGFIETTNPELREVTIPFPTSDGIQEVPLYDLMIHKAMRDGRADTPSEASRQLRAFPEWYKQYAKMPDEIYILTKIEEEKNRLLYVEKKKEEIMKEINALLDSEDKSSENLKRFKELSSVLKQLKA